MLRVGEDRGTIREIIMTLTSNQLWASTLRRTRLVEICEAFPEVGVEPGGGGHVSELARRAYQDFAPRKLPAAID
jgi:hypothetical protein